MPVTHLTMPRYSLAFDRRDQNRWFVYRRDHRAPGVWWCVAAGSAVAMRAAYQLLQQEAA